MLDFIFLILKLKLPRNVSKCVPLCISDVNRLWLHSQRQHLTRSKRIFFQALWFSKIRFTEKFKHRLLKYSKGWRCSNFPVSVILNSTVDERPVFAEVKGGHFLLLLFIVFSFSFLGGGIAADAMWCSYKLRTDNKIKSIRWGWFTRGLYTCDGVGVGSTRSLCKHYKSEVKMNIKLLIAVCMDLRFRFWFQILC